MGQGLKQLIELQNQFNLNKSSGNYLAKKYKLRIRNRLSRVLKFVAVVTVMLVISLAYETKIASFIFGNYGIVGVVMQIALLFGGSWATHWGVTFLIKRYNQSVISKRIRKDSAQVMMEKELYEKTKDYLCGQNVLPKQYLNSYSIGEIIKILQHNGANKVYEAIMDFEKEESRHREHAFRMAQESEKERILRKIEGKIKEGR